MKKMVGMFLGGMALAPSLAFAEDTINSGDTAWVLASSALVLLMTPGLAFFYGGMVGKKNVVTTIFQSIIAIAVLGLTWAIAGYSLSFSGNVGGLIGDFGALLLNGVNGNVRPTTGISHETFMIFQCMFAVITPALITGSFAERMKFKGWITFSILWSLLVYAPVCHWVWGTDGWIAKMGGLDFAGGMVVHMTAGFSALVFALMFGKSKLGPNKPYDVGLVTVGTTMLFIGWFGFNAGSALSSGPLAAHAFTTTFLSACSAAVMWALVDTIRTGKPTLMGVCIAIVVGLVVITPAAGFVTNSAAIIMGLLGALICNLMVTVLKEKFHVDDRLDVFACHGVGGFLGTIFTGLFATTTVNSAGANGLFYGNPHLLNANLISTAAVALFAMVMTYLIAKGLSLFTTLKVDEKTEATGLDESEHGEKINNYIG